VSIDVANNLLRSKKFIYEEVAIKIKKIIMPKINSRACTDIYIARAINDEILTVKEDEI
jgi:hypothetical protein